MLGLVNHALQEMVTERLGAEEWDSIRARCGVEDRVFVIMRQYPDEVTYRLAGGVAERLGITLAEALRAFGVRWMAFAERQPWGKVMRSMGSSTRELLPALDALHDRIALSFPDVTMPKFRCEPLPDGSLRIHYMSPRPGLAPFVLGALEGIGAMYREEVRVSVVERREDGAPHDVFLVEFPGERVAR